jgi:2-methylfumaryl-CoA isomerase
MIKGILSGLRIVEVSAFVAAPLAGATLAALGAEVIRVEQLGGGIDVGRWPLHGGRSLYRQGLDQGKQSVAVNLQSSRGQELVADLVTAPGADAGILVTNLGNRGWLSYRGLAERRPDLIMVVIEGTHEGGSAVDYTVNAGVGFPWVTGAADSDEPVNHVLPAWDVAAGFLASTAVLAADRHRHLTGAGQLVRLPLSDVALAVAGHLGFLAEAKLVEEPRGRFGNDVYGTYGRDFRTRDGRHVMVCALTVRQWQGLCEATELSSAFRELENTYGIHLADEGERFIHRTEISGLLEPWIAAHTLDEVRFAFDANDVLWGPYRSFKELVNEDVRASSPLASPLVFADFEQQLAPPAPEVGADTQRVFREVLQIDDEGIAQLRKMGVIS